MKPALTFLLAALLFAAGHKAYGQANMEDVVYLKNGNILRGIIIEHVPNKSIKLQMMDRSVKNFTYEEIDKLAQETRPKQAGRAPADAPGYEFKSSGYMFIAELGFSPGVGTVRVNGRSMANKDHAISLRMVHGGYLSEHWSLGLGIGYEKYKQSALLPVTIDTRATFVKGNISPFIGMNAGYALSVESASGGITINPSLGIKTAVSDNSALMFSVGYKWVKQEIVSQNYYGYYYSRNTDAVFFQFLTLHTGFSF